jgi:hypothetical protein
LASKAESSKLANMADHESEKVRRAGIMLLTAVLLLVALAGLAFIVMPPKGKTGKKGHGAHGAHGRAPAKARLVRHKSSAAAARVAFARTWQMRLGRHHRKVRIKASGPKYATLRLEWANLKSPSDAKHFEYLKTAKPMHRHARESGFQRLQMWVGGQKRFELKL